VHNYNKRRYFDPFAFHHKGTFTSFLAQIWFHLGFEVITATTIKNAIFWGLTPCGVIKCLPTFRKNVLPPVSGSKIKLSKQVHDFNSVGSIREYHRLNQWYSTWGTRRHLREYVKLKKYIYVLFRDKCCIIRARFRVSHRRPGYKDIRFGAPFLPPPPLCDSYLGG
jgi:hypothetical protein